MQLVNVALPFQLAEAHCQVLGGHLKLASFDDLAITHDAATLCGGIQQPCFIGACSIEDWSGTAYTPPQDATTQRKGPGSGQAFTKACATINLMAATHPDIHWVTCSEERPFICTYNPDNEDIVRRESNPHSCIHASAAMSKAKVEDMSRKQGPVGMLLRRFLAATKKSRSVHLTISKAVPHRPPPPIKRSTETPSRRAPVTRRRLPPLNRRAPPKKGATRSPPPTTKVTIRRPPPPKKVSLVKPPPPKVQLHGHPPPPKKAPPAVVPPRPTFDLAAAAAVLLTVKGGLIDPLNNLASWTGASPCGLQAPWVGVFCEPGPHGALVVSGLDISGLGLSGPLPAALAQLKDLGYLHAGLNYLSGPLPDLSGLVLLCELDLSFNFFSGPIPAWLASLPWLRYLDLRFNTFTGSIPAALFNSVLQQLDVLV
eukprot:SM000182S03951  [mRNA]  locus=s182:288306:290894:- [translate_table: standard]